MKEIRTIESCKLKIENAFCLASELIADFLSARSHQKISENQFKSASSVFHFLHFQIFKFSNYLIVPPFLKILFKKFGGLENEVHFCVAMKKQVINIQWWWHTNSSGVV
jgi:hypothetical protein